MSRTHDEMLAYALEAEVDLLPHLPGLLSDLEELGSDSELLAEVIGALPLPDDARVIDLGCGKGATAFEIADSLGLKVTGIDLFEPFIRHCEQMARDQDLADLCQFLQGDLAQLSDAHKPVDVAIFAALGDVIGSLDQAISVVRQHVKPGGFIVISDCYVRAGGTNTFPGFEQYGQLDETIARLTSACDVLVRQVVQESADQSDDDEIDEAALIVARARAIAARHPEVGDAVMAFAASQAEENNYIADNLVDAIWVLEKR